MGPDAIIDASPLIYFAKLDRLALLGRIVGHVAITPGVHRETVDKGRLRGHEDAERVAAAVQQGLITLVQLDSEEHEMVRRLQEDPRLGPGECETIACAAQRGLLTILEDKKARHVAATLGVRTRKSADVLFLGLIRSQLTLAEFKELLRELARITGIDPATLFEHEAMAEEIASRIGPDRRRQT